MCLKFTKNDICVDGTHGLNSHNFYLYSVIVFDEFGNGIPIAFCFFNLKEKNNIVYATFFNTVMGKVGFINISVFMSDSGTAFYNAWICVMNILEYKLYFVFGMSLKIELKTRVK